MTAVDEEGRAVTLIQSLYAHFGAGLLEPSTGVILHNRGGAFSLEQGHPGVPRRRRAPAAHAVPVDRPDAGDAVVALGCQGGRAQPQILAQVAPDAVADPASDLQAAVGAAALDRRRRRTWATATARRCWRSPGADAPEAEAASGRRRLRAPRRSPPAGPATCRRAAWGPTG